METAGVLNLPTTETYPYGHQEYFRFSICVCVYDRVEDMRSIS